MEVNIASIVILFTGVVGLLLANHIRKKKKKNKNQPFVCPLNFDCHNVVTSRYSKFLGIPLDLWGILYYGFIVVSYTSFFVKPELKTDVVVYGVMGVSLIAFVVSLYLTFVQAFRLKEWCSWCLFSAGLCTIIFLAAFVGVFGIINTVAVL